MDIFSMLVVQMFIHFLTKVNATELISSLAMTPNSMSCGSPFLSLYAIGFIQCQKACVRYLGCEVLKYSKHQFKCFLYFGDTCSNTTDTSHSEIYLRRSNIDQVIGGSCLISECDILNACIAIGQGSICLPDKVLQQYSVRRNNAFIDIDGKQFGLFPSTRTHSEAQHYCNSNFGRLAVLDTTRKLQIISDETQRISSTYWYVGVTRNTEGEWFWSNGEHVYVTENEHNVRCGIVLQGRVNDHSCYDKVYFVCEIL